MTTDDRHCPVAVIVVPGGGTIDGMDDSLHATLTALRDAPALAGDPRPGTRDLAQTALGALGIELVDASAQRVAARMHVESTGSSGMLLVLAETVASTGAGLAAGDGKRAFGAELNASLLAQPAPGAVVAAATPLRLQSERQVWRIVAIDAAGAQVLEARCTLGVVSDVGAGIAQAGDTARHE